MTYSSSPPHAPGQSLPRLTLRQAVTSKLLAAIFQGNFEPEQRLIVQRLSEQFEVSPTPIREALLELESLGVVSLLPNKGAIVHPFGPEQVREIGQVRRVLEVEAARSACGRIPEDATRRLADELLGLRDLPRGDERDATARLLDNRLHFLIASSCGSRRLGSEIERYLTLFRTLRDVSHSRDAATNYSRSDDIGEHLAILDRLLDRDAAGAADSMDEHICSSTRTIENVLFA